MAAHVGVKFLRLNAWPAGVRFEVLWNGVIDPTSGEGKPGADPDGAVDEANPLTASPIECWPVGKAGLGSGPAGRHPAGYPGNTVAGYDYGNAPAGAGELGLYNDDITWRTDSTAMPTLRDGAYKFAIRFVDECGTAQTDPLQEVTVIVRGTPRPPTRLRTTGWNSQANELGVSWTASPDLVAA